MKLKKINIPHTIWIISIFALLITILIMVMDYKINYEYNNDVNKRIIYFYDCNGEVCTSETKNNNKKAYSEYICYTKCPKFKKIIEEDYALLQNNEGYILYNYKEGKKIAEGYEEYKFINTNYIIVKKNKLEGVIDAENNITVPINYTQVGYYKNKILTGYNTAEIIIRSDKSYGIINYKTGEIVEELKYTEEDLNTLQEKISS